MKRKNVFVLHSYHDMGWTRSIQEGIESVFDKSSIPVEMYVEWMDTMRYPPKDSFGYLEELYRKKYDRTSFDVVLVSDNNALEFILSRRDKLFPGVPIVFCGINDFRKEQLRGQSGITGVNEDIDIKGTIKLALSILPDVRKFVVVSDRTATGLANRKKFQQTLAGYSGEKPVFELLDDLTAKDLLKKLGTLSADSAVLLFTFKRDREGLLFTQPEYVNLIVKGCNVPVFSFWETDLPYGVLGGVMVSGKMQGERSAEYVLRILKGEPVSSLPFIMKSPNVSVLNYPLLKRFGIPKEIVPEGTIILNEPTTFYYRYETIIWLISGFIVSIVLIDIFLFINIIRRKRVEKALREAHWRLASIIEGTNVGTWEWNVQTGETFFNEVWAQIIGYTLDELAPVSIETWKALAHPDDLKRSGDLLERHFAGELAYYDCECRMKHKDGHWVWIRDRGRVITCTNDGKPLMMFGTHTDINDRKQAEEKIRMSLREKETMVKEIHHRVKNNLQVISSLLGLQSSFIRDEQSKEAFRESQNRVRAMAMIHTQLYQSEDLAKVDFGGFIGYLISRLQQIYGASESPIQVHTEIHDISLTIETSIPCGLILNELVTNALKHAFPGRRSGEINISMITAGDQFSLTVRDNGIGFPEAVDFYNAKSLGLGLVNVLVGQLNGTIAMTVGGGTAFTVTFPSTNKRG